MSTTVAATSAAGSRARPVAAPVGHALVSSQCSCGAAKSGVEETCDACSGLMRQPQPLGGPADGPGTPAVPPIIGDVLGTPGRPLDEDNRGFFEHRFRRDLAHVRIHTGSRAAASARSIAARAYTSGHHIVFGQGEYRPGSPTTRRLLAHEITHVVQQRSGLKADVLEQRDTPAEHEADGNERRLMAGEAPHVTARTTGISRTCAASSAGEHYAEATSSAADCGRRKRGILRRTFNRAGDWICQTVQKLRALIDGPDEEENAGTRESFGRHFHSTAPRDVEQAWDVLSTLSDDMADGRYDVDCGRRADPSCDDTRAYVPGMGSDRIVFCPSFFRDPSARDRTLTVVHEVAHTSGVLDVDDRAYQSDRQLPFLTTPEALRNAESYELLIREVVTGRPVSGTAPRDEIEDCAEDLEPMVRRALGLAERWNDAAGNIQETSSFGADLFEQYLSDSSREMRRDTKKEFDKAERRFGGPLQIQCEQDGDNECAENSAYGDPAVDNINLATGLGMGIGAGLGLGVGLGLGLGLASSLGATAGVVGLAAGLGLFLVGTIAGLVAGALTSSGNTIHICARWRGEPERDRARSILAAVYSMQDSVDIATGRVLAGLARDLHDEDVTDVN